MIKYVVVFMLLVVAGCKKESSQSVQHACPGGQTFAASVGSVMGTAVPLAIYEDVNGAIHVSANDNGTWKVFQFNINGSYIRTVNLGPYSAGKTLTVHDGYYVSSYTESSDTTGIHGPHDGIFQGWKQVSSRAGVCGPYIIFDTCVLPIPVHAALTAVNKIDFTGASVWTHTYNGYLPGGVSPVTFSATGDMYVFTIDYKGPQRLLLINGHLYEVNDPNRPGFNVTDTILYNDTINHCIITKTDAATGNANWQKNHLFNHCGPDDITDTWFAVLNTGIFVSCQNTIYQFDLAGNYKKDLYPLDSACSGMLDYGYIRPTFDGSKLLISEYYNGNYFLAETDGNATQLWKSSLAPNSWLLYNMGVITGLNNIIATNHYSGLNIYTAQGQYTNVVEPCSVVNGCNNINSTYTCASCSGDILNVVSSTVNGVPLVWLIRMHGDGTM